MKMIKGLFFLGFNANRSGILYIDSVFIYGWHVTVRELGYIHAKEKRP